MTATYAEEVRRADNEQYRKGCFGEALRLYDCALVVCSDNARKAGEWRTVLRESDAAIASPLLWLDS
jgi:hypothetical protein